MQGLRLAKPRRRPVVFSLVLIFVLTALVVLGGWLRHIQRSATDARGAPKSGTPRQPEPH